MHAFWRSGFSGTTTRDLEAALDINASSLYNAFGSKDGAPRRGHRALPARHGCGRARSAAAPGRPAWRLSMSSFGGWSAGSPATAAAAAWSRVSSPRAATYGEPVDTLISGYRRDLRAALRGPLRRAAKFGEIPAATRRSPAGGADRNGPRPEPRGAGIPGATAVRRHRRGLIAARSPRGQRAGCRRQRSDAPTTRPAARRTGGRRSRSRRRRGARRGRGDRPAGSRGSRATSPRACRGPSTLPAARRGRRAPGAGRGRPSGGHRTCSCGTDGAHSRSRRPSTTST